MYPLLQNTNSQYVPVLLQDATGGFVTDSTSIVVEISKNGGDFITPSLGTYTNKTDGLYYVQCDSTDSNTVGPLVVKIESDDAVTSFALCYVRANTEAQIISTGESNWLTATGFATPTNVSDIETSIKSYGDSNWSTADLTTISSNISTLLSDLTSVASNVSTVISNIAALDFTTDSDLTPLTNSLSQILTDLTSLQSIDYFIPSDLTSLQSDVTQIISDIAALDFTTDADLTGIQGDITTLLTNVSTLQTSINNLNDYSGLSTAEITLITDAIQALSEITNMDTFINGSATINTTNRTITYTNGANNLTYTYAANGLSRTVS